MSRVELTPDNILDAIAAEVTRRDTKPVTTLTIPPLGSNYNPSSLDDLDRNVLIHATQDNVALMFRKHCEGKLVFIHDGGGWHYWTGTHWAKESKEAAFNFTRIIAREVNTEGKSNIGSANFCRGVEAFARADPAFSRLINEFDAENYLFNTPAGVIDLRTNEMRPTLASDNLICCANVGPSNTHAGIFNKFLDEITEGDHELSEYLQISLGSILSGAIESHWLLFWVGKGRNGKNTLGDLVSYIFGDYARKVPSDTLMSKTHRGHPTEIMNLRGVRLAISSEVSDGERWNEARLNEVTGDEVLSGRFISADFVTFKRTHKHLIFANHRPQLVGVSDGIGSRLKIVPFRASFLGREDADLPAKLRTEAGYVLTWLLAGHQKWLDLGKKLPACKAVEDESKDYLDSQATVEMWVRENCDPIPESASSSDWSKASVLYANYKNWKGDRGESPVSMQRWGETMKKHFPPKSNNGIRYPLRVIDFGAFANYSRENGGF